MHWYLRASHHPLTPGPATSLRPSCNLIDWVSSEVSLSLEIVSSPCFVQLVFLLLLLICHFANYFVWGKLLLLCNLRVQIECVGAFHVSLRFDNARVPACLHIRKEWLVACIMEELLWNHPSSIQCKNYQDPEPWTWLFAHETVHIG
jgi:hypothetical protein